MATDINMLIIKALKSKDVSDLIKKNFQRDYDMLLKSNNLIYYEKIMNDMNRKLIGENIQLNVVETFRYLYTKIMVEVATNKDDEEIMIQAIIDTAESDKDIEEDFESLYKKIDEFKKLTKKKSSKQKKTK